MKELENAKQEISG